MVIIYLLRVIYENEKSIHDFDSGIYEYKISRVSEVLIYRTSHACDNSFCVCLLRKTQQNIRIYGDNIFIAGYLRERRIHISF